jgi:hypothetical protein
VAYSWSRRKKEPSTGNTESVMGRMTPAGTARLWDMWNIAGEWAFRDKKTPYLLVRYEDFINEPIRTIENIIDLVGEPVTKLPFASDRSINLGINHTLAGNPNRFTTGVQEIRMDDIWKTKMKRGHRTMVTSMTWPLLKRYGYDLRIQ